MLVEACRHYWIFLGLLVSWASSEPSCNDIEGYRYRRYICRDFESSTDFQNHVKPLPSAKDTWFLLLDSTLDHIPARSFAGMNVSVLIFSNVTVNLLNQSEPANNPFAGLEDTLTKMVFRRQSTLPQDWNLLGGMKKLEDLHIQGYINLNLTRNFEKLPESLKEVFIFDATINRVDENWLSSLHNLEAVIIRVTNMGNFTRSMLPESAPSLRTLDMADNNLSEFPSGLGGQFPKLRFINMEDNQITTLREEDLSQLHKDGVGIRFIGNPMHCDCKLWFLLDYTDRWHYFLCRSPEEHYGRYIKTFTEPELPCTNRTEVVTQDSVVPA